MDYFSSWLHVFHNFKFKELRVQIDFRIVTKRPIEQGKNLKMKLKIKFNFSKASTENRKFSFKSRLKPR